MTNFIHICIWYTIIIYHELFQEVAEVADKSGAAPDGKDAKK